MTSDPIVHTNRSASVNQEDEHAPVFIAGIMPRSGTNFLHRLLCQHPDCGAINTTPVREDYLLHHAASLRRYVSRLRWQWGHWGADEAFVAPLARHAGRGLTDFLRTLSDARRIVTKTPSAANIDLFPSFFPHAFLMIIVRDGRSVVASGMSGFGWNFETAAREWARSARTILTFKKNNAGFSDRYRIVRYEDVNERTAEELESILLFLQLDTAVYDFEAALETPVYGSSFQKTGDEQVTWKPQEKTDAFGKSERWAAWSRARHQRFNWIAGRELAALGYEPLHAGNAGFAWKHRVLDALYHVRRIPRTLRNATKAGVRASLETIRGQQEGKTDLKK